MLTRREREIARAYADGDTYQRIAIDLGIAPSTVCTHLTAIYRKLGVSSKLELLRILQGEDTAADRQTDTAALVSELALSLEESISRERALGAVLRIISRANGEIGDVIEAVLDHALELCDAEFGILFEYDETSGFDARYFRNIPQPFADWFTERGPFHPDAATGLGRMAATREVV
ncbi:MAG: helix-turn-helix transcriptional regulator, partial [Alphaproteobacteria bacterium]